MKPSEEIKFSVENKDLLEEIKPLEEIKSLEDSKKANNVTFVTAYYSASGNKKDFLESGVKTLKICQPMVIYVEDEESSEFIKQVRTSYNLLEMRKIIIMPLSKFYFYKYRDIIEKNREKFWGSKDIRCNTDVHIVTLSKFNFVYDAIINDFFNTTHVGWIDFNLLDKSPHNSINYTSDTVYKKIDTISMYPKDGFSATILNFWLPSFYNDLKEFYASYKYICVGGFHTTDIKTGLKIFPKLINYAECVTYRGYDHGEEHIFGHIIDHNLEDFNLSIGDCQDAIENYHNITSNHSYCQYVIDLYKNNRPQRYKYLLPYINSSNSAKLKNSLMDSWN